MDRSFWLERWAKEEIGFHESEFNSHLVNEGHRFAADGTVFVPLCGKSRDMIWLSEQGHEVVGVELADQACESFFTENRIPFERETSRGFTRFRSKTVTLFAGDYFQVQSSDLARPIDGFYDRGALIALPREMRSPYVDKLIELADDPRRQVPIQGLLIVIEFDPAALQGPPFPITREEIVQLYGKRFEIHTLYEASEKGEIRGVPLEITERVYDLRGR